MPKFDYWNDDYHDGADHIGEPHGGPHHDNFYDDYPNHHHHPEPPFDGRRHQPIDIGKVDTTKMHDRYDMHVPHHMPPWGFKFPKLEKAFVPGSTPQEQVAYLLNRVDIMIDYFNHYDDKVWGAYNAIVHSALGNDAYYREITREEGYLADGSTPYTVIHIPYLDRADRPIFLELGLAYNNTTNNGVKENVFEASQNRIADKLIPAFNIADGWEGKAMLKGAPIQSAYTEGKFTLAVTDNGFLKIYPNSVAYEQLNRDRIRNAMGVQGVLINNGAKTPEQYATNGGELLARVGIGMNYETKERIIVIVNGNPTPPNDASVTGATADMLADIFARYGCTVAVETANNGSAVAMDKGQMIYMPDTALTGTIPTVPSLNCYWYITKRRHYHNQYVKDVADLIQKVGQNKWRCEIALQSCDFLKGRVNELQRDLDAEVQNRIDADEQLQANIDAEEQARIDADEQLQDNIDAEAEARRQADAQLQDNIDAEATAREQGDNALDTRITNEVNVLNNRITQVVTELNNAIATERQARIDGDTALSTRIDNEVATLNALIDAEEQARIAGDTALQNSLTQLREDYTAFLTTYANDLAETRRLLTALRSDISTIQGQIAQLQSNLSAVNTSITAILATINTIEQSFENIKTAFTALQAEWHDYKDDVDAEIAQLQQEWATYKTTIMSEVETLVREIIAEEGGITPEIMALIQNAQWKTMPDVLFNETVETVESGGEYYAPLLYNEAITDDPLIVTFDGVEYTCPRIEDLDGQAFYGGYNDGPDYSTYPFFIVTNEHGENGIITETGGSHTVSALKNSQYNDSFINAVKEIAGEGLKYVKDSPNGSASVGGVIEGDVTTNVASGVPSHAEGSNTTASGANSHAEGSYTQATEGCAHAEGENTVASGYGAHAEGNQTEASGFPSHSEGTYTKATADGSHAEGNRTEASGSNSHAEGGSTKATGESSHAEGSNSVASGNSSHAEGNNTEASGYMSHAEGQSTIAKNAIQHVFGKYNTPDPSTNASTVEGNFVEIVGNGAGINNRSNARTLDWAGNERLAGSLTLRANSNPVTITADQLQALLNLLPQS